MYRSTRGRSPAISFSQAVLEGLAEDGGLLVPETIPDYRHELLKWSQLEYPQLAERVLSGLCDLCPEALRRSCQTAYGPRYGGPVAPLVEWGDRYLLELFHGPTLAFKDVALQLLGQFFELILTEQNRHLNIVAATSGDTGSAAIHGVLGCPRVNIFVTHPKGKIAELQRLQMSTVLEPNVFNLPVEGTFDDCQAMVKELASDLDFKRKYSIGAVNSINWARIAAQIVYYFAAYLQTPGAARGVPAVFAVPTGNFGNILAGHIAREMGLPIRRLVLATNENNVLEEFFRTGIYRPRTSSQTLATSSPSMDISKASNFERFIYDLFDQDPAAVRRCWEQLAREGSFDLSHLRPQFEERWGFVSGVSSHADRLETIRRVHAEAGVLIDPHTADGVKVAAAHVETGVPMLVLETALPAKFAETIQEATGQLPPVPEALRGLADLPQRVEQLPCEASAVRQYILDHLAPPA